MKNIINSVMQRSFVLPVVLFLLLFNACSENEEIPKPVTDDDDDPQVIVVETPASIEEGGFQIKSDNLVQTDDGYNFDGTLIAENNQKDTFAIGQGDFEVVIGDDNEIEIIIGVGMPEFPKIGIFKKMLESFDWSPVKSHFEYRTGAYYKDTYQTDLPLTDNRKYLHIKVFDENKGDYYELKNTANGFIYSFVDFYVDILDPSVFFKAPMIIPKPSSGKGTILQKIVGKISDKGKNIPNVGISGGIAYGFSSQGLIESQSYDFENDALFELLGYERFESFKTHAYKKAAGLPFPPLPIFQINMESYIGYPVENFLAPPEDIIEKKEEAFLEWVADPMANVDLNYRVSGNGSIDMGGFGIGMILGILPNANGIIGNVFNEEINLDVTAGTMQYQLAPGNSFLKLGGEVNRPFLREIFHEDIRKYIPSQPIQEGFMFLSIGDDLEDWSMFIETSMVLNVPAIGDMDFNHAYLHINEEQIEVEGMLELPTYGILNHNRRFKGRISKDGIELESEYNHDITLPNGVTLIANGMKLIVSTQDGVYLKGNMILPFGTTESEVIAHLSKEKISFEGTISQGLDLSNGIDLPSRNFTFLTSSDPDEGFALHGELDVPHIGYNKVTGILNNGELTFIGEVERTLEFANVSLPISQGKLSISDKIGIQLDGFFNLPAGLLNTKLSGSISENEMNLKGSTTRGLTVSGHTFNFSSSSITASTTTGVTMSGNINLYLFTAKVSGAITSEGNFSLKGSRQYSASIGPGKFSSSVGITVNNSGVDMRGNGTVTGLLGNTLYSGAYTISPNWSNKTFKVCYKGNCYQLP